MKVVHYSETESKSFNGDNVKNVNGRVVIGKDDGAANFCMRVFTVGTEGYTPRHSHEWEHEIFIHSGRGQVFRKGEWADIEAGNVLFIPGNEEHQLRNNGDGDFVFVCLIPSGVAEL